MERSPIPIGSKFSRLIVTGPAVKTDAEYKVPAACVCGNTGLFSKRLLRFGHTKSCGCLKSEATVISNSKRGKTWKAGDVIGRLTVNEVLKKEGKTYLAVVCACGTEKEVLAYDLSKGRTKSCGCLRSELVSAKNTTHGMSHTLVYGVWKSMLERCESSSCTSYSNYGGRGITVSEAWHDFSNFYSDMGEPPFIGATLERVDNNVGYSKDNCKWASRREQSLNTRRSKLFDYLGRNLPLDVIASEVGLGLDTLYYRVNALGLSVAEAIAYTNESRKTKFKYKGEDYSVQQLAALSGISKSVLSNRLHAYKWSVERAVETPVKRQHVAQPDNTQT